MAKPDPDRLIVLAQGLLRPSERWPPQEDLRRAISTAYYAVFHWLSAQAANWLIGKGRGQGQVPNHAYTAAYRSVDHSRLRAVCVGVGGGGGTLRPPGGWAEDVIKAAKATATLQDRRHDADYNPAFWLEPTDARFEVESAKQCLSWFAASFEGEGWVQKEAFLGMLVFRPRTGADRAG